MLRNLLLIGLLLIFAAACTPTATEETASQNTETEETHEDELAEEAHEEEEHDEDEHDEDEHDEHEMDEDHREHGAHEHGAAELFVAWSGNELAIDLETPAYNVLGFEYAPSSDAEKALLEESVAALETGELLQLSPDAECTLVSAVVDTEMAEEAHEEHDEHEDEEHEDEEAHDEDEHDEEDDHEEDDHSDEHDEHEDHEDEETHSDISVSYNIQCEQPDNLESLDASELFVQFPNFEDIRAQWVSDSAQSAKELTADDPILPLR